MEATTTLEFLTSATFERDPNLSIWSNEKAPDNLYLKFKDYQEYRRCLGQLNSESCEDLFDLNGALQSNTNSSSVYWRKNKGSEFKLEESPESQVFEIDTFLKNVTDEQHIKAQEELLEEERMNTIDLPPMYYGSNKKDVLPTDDSDDDSASGDYDSNSRSNKKGKQKWYYLSGIPAFNSLREILKLFLKTGCVDKVRINSLNERSREIVFKFFDGVVKSEKIKEIEESTLKIFKLEEQDFEPERKDAQFKLILSQCLKTIMKNFLKANSINKSLNPRRYVKRTEINKRIYQFFFNKEPHTEGPAKKHISDLIFKIGGGITKSWFDLIAQDKHFKLLKEVLRLLDFPTFLLSYEKKMDSMLNRLLSTYEEHEGKTEEHQASEVLKKFTQEKLKRPKTMIQIKGYIEATMAKLKEFSGKYPTMKPLFK
jgi:hypothetical protein